MAEIVLERISKRYGGVFRRRPLAPALNDLTLAVNSGELLVIVGPSGSGKTTALRLIAGLEQPTSGSIRIGGRDVTRLRPSERNVAMVFQEFTLYPHMTAMRNIAFPLKNRGVSKIEIERKVIDAARALDIEPLLDRKPGELSGGERQRVALARGLVINPDCLLLDEPLSQIDPRLRSSLRTQIKSLQANAQLTMVYVTHDQQEAMMLGDRIAVLHHGELQQLATPMELYRHPANRFVAEFFGSPTCPMNFIAGRIVRQQGPSGGLLFQSDDQMQIPIPRNSEESLGRFVDQEIRAGIRPEDLKDRASADSPSMIAINLIIESIDWLGDQMIVHGRTDSGIRMAARRNVNENTRIGDLMRVSVDLNCIHYFEASQPGKSLLQKI